MNNRQFSSDHEKRVAKSVGGDTYGKIDQKRKGNTLRDWFKFHVLGIISPSKFYLGLYSKKEYQQIEKRRNKNEQQALQQQARKAGRKNNGRAEATE